MRDTIYVIKGTRLERDPPYIEFGTLRTRILGYARGDRDEIKSQYEKKGYITIDVEPIEIKEFPESNRRNLPNRLKRRLEVLV